jgi:hypothetical protein
VNPAACGGSGLQPRPQLDRLGARPDRRQTFGKRSRRGADESALLEHVERPRPLSDEVRRRREPRLPGDAAARQQPDHVVAEEPARSLGGITRVCILRQEDDEAAI